MRNLKVLCLVLVAAMAASFSVASVAEDKIAVVDIAQAIFSSMPLRLALSRPRPVLILLPLKQSSRALWRICSHWLKKLKPSVLLGLRSKLQSHQKKMEYVKADAELARRKIQAEQKQLQQQIMQELGPKAQEALQEVVKEEGITILLRADAVMVAGPESNLTAKVADRLNKKTK